MIMNPNFLCRDSHLVKGEYVPGNSAMPPLVATCSALPALHPTTPLQRQSPWQPLQFFASRAGWDLNVGGRCSRDQTRVVAGASYFWCRPRKFRCTGVWWRLYRIRSIGTCTVSISMALVTFVDFHVVRVFLITGIWKVLICDFLFFVWKETMIGWNQILTIGAYSHGNHLADSVFCCSAILFQKCLCSTELKLLQNHVDEILCNLLNAAEAKLKPTENLVLWTTEILNR